MDQNIFGAESTQAASAFNLLGSALDKQDKIEGAEKFFRQAIELDRKLPATER